MKSWVNLDYFMGAKFVIRNGVTGTYIHDTMSKIKTFDTHAEAREYIKKKGLNQHIYIVEVM